MNLDKNILAEFQSLTGFDIVSYYASFTNFMQLDYNYLVEYYSGKTATLNSQSFNNLTLLLAMNKDLFSSFTQSKDRLNNLKFWDLMIQIEEIDSALMTVKNISRWLRSPITNNGFANKTEVDITLKQNQTLELLSKDTLRDDDYQNGWNQVAQRNNLTEESYTSEGGNLLAVSFSRSGRLFVNAVVDNLNGMNILGKDIYQKLTFENNDLKVLGYIDTFKQAVLILSGLKTNDDPFNADQGILVKDVVGSNVNLVNLPLIFRKMSQTFALDDTIESFAITGVKRSSGALYATFEVRSILDQVSEFKINLSN
jgi:hypothetical protein